MKETREMKPDMFMISGRIKNWTERVAEAISRRPSFSVIKLNFENTNGEKRINPKVAIKESWKEGSFKRESGFQRSIRKPARNSARRALPSLPICLANIAIRAIIEARTTVAVVLQKVPS